MELDFKYLIPLAGVLLGWILSQFSGAINTAKELRQYRSSALPPMLDLYFQQYRIDQILKFFNLRLGDSMEKLHKIYEKHDIPKEKRLEIFSLLVEKFEQTRQGNLDLPEKNKEYLFRALDTATLSLSKADPVSAYRLSRLLAEFILLLEIKFPSNEINSEKYLSTWGYLLQTFRNDMGDLRKLILKVSLGIGLVTFLRIWWLLRSEEKLLEQPPEGVLEDLVQTLKPNQEMHAKSE